MISKSNIKFGIRNKRLFRNLINLYVHGRYVSQIISHMPTLAANDPNRTKA